MCEYGKNLGLSFQIVDDLLDFKQSAEQLGKRAGADLAKGNLTALVIYALEKDLMLGEIVESEFSDSGSLDEAISLVKRCGGNRASTGFSEREPIMLFRHGHGKNTL
ncbi:putative protein serine/threonine kinase [Ancistrocladus abbreviatus]